MSAVPIFLLPNSFSDKKKVQKLVFRWAERVFWQVICEFGIILFYFILPRNMKVLVVWAWNTGKYMKLSTKIEIWLYSWNLNWNSIHFFAVIFVGIFAICTFYQFSCQKNLWNFTISILFEVRKRKHLEVIENS